MIDKKTRPYQYRKCRFCRSPIDASAKKCPHCLSSYGSLGWLKNAATELSALSVFVAVFALSLPAIKSVLPQRSDLVIAVLKAEGRTFEFMVSNKGNRPAAITQAGLEFPANQDGQTYHMWLRLEEGHFRTIVINPEKSYRFAADVMSEDNIPPLQPAPGAASEIAHAAKAFPDNCILKLVYADFDGTERVIRKKYRCAVG